jgi:hypothetical protein
MRRRTSQLRLQQIGAVATAYRDSPWPRGWRMIRKKPAPHLMRGVQRFSEKIMRKQ